MPNFQSFDPVYYKRLFQLEKRSFWFRYRNMVILDALEKHMSGGGSYLEIGCGTGYVMSEIHQTHQNVAMSGADIFVEGIAYAQSRVPESEFYLMDVCNIPFDAEFDVIGAFDVFEHIEDDEKALSEIYRALKPNGVMILTVPQHPWIWSIQDERACHKRRYTRKELRLKAMRIGFSIDLIHSFISLLFPFMGLSRVCSRSISRWRNGYDELSGLNLPVFLDRFFMKICMLERHLANRGVHFPWGGSLLCVALKV